MTFSAPVKKALKQLCFVAVFILVPMLDLLTKSLVTKSLREKPPVTLIDGILELTYTTNTGGAFSLLDSHPAVITVIAAVLILAGIVYVFVSKAESFGFSLSLCITLAGGIGNLIERAKIGYVTDFIRTLFIDFPVFNVADIFVTAGVFALAFFTLRDWHREKKTA